MTLVVTVFFIEACIKSILKYYINICINIIFLISLKLMNYIKVFRYKIYIKIQY